MDPALIFIALGALVAGFVQGLSGFAFGMVATSIWAWAVEPRLAAVLAVFGGLTGQVIAAVTVRRGFDWRRLAPFVGGGLLGCRSACGCCRGWMFRCSRCCSARCWSPGAR
jgi:uncharacterized membrane protein YfcA